MTTIFGAPLASLGALFGVLAGSSVAAAQSGGWVASFSGHGTDFANAVASAPDGDVFAAGGTLSAGAGSLDAWVARLDGRGKTRWEFALGGSGFDEAAAVLATADGGCVLVGSTSSFGAGLTDGWIVELAAGGAVEWERTYGGADSDRFGAIAVSPDGYYVGGNREDPVTGTDAWVLELDPAGGVLWQQVFAAEGSDALKAIAATLDGLVVTIDSTSPLCKPCPSAPFGRPWVVRMDGDGNALWQKTYHEHGGAAWNRIVPLADGGFVACGEILGNGFFRGDAWIVRLDAAGSIVWDRRYGDHFGVPWVDYAVGVAPTADGGFGVACTTGTAGAGSEDLWFLKLDSGGALEWDTTYGGPAYDIALGMDATPQGDFLVAGRGQSFVTRGADALVFRLDPGGDPNCDLSSPTAPHAWSGTPAVDAVDVAPAPSGVRPRNSSAHVTPLATGSYVCPPG